jgi:RHS repeat-associated protein
MFSNYQIIPTSKILIGSKLLEKEEFANNEGLNWYNYDVRPYDPQIGRWHNPDILAETSTYVSPYAYCDANPVNFTDPSGMKKEPPRERIEYPQQSSNFDWSGGAGNRGGFASGGGDGGLNGPWGGYGNYLDFRIGMGANFSHQGLGYSFENGILSVIKAKNNCYLYSYYYIEQLWTAKEIDGNLEIELFYNEDGTPIIRKQTAYVMLAYVVYSAQSGGGGLDRKDWFGIGLGGVRGYFDIKGNALHNDLYWKGKTTGKIYTKNPFTSTKVGWKANSFKATGKAFQGAKSLGRKLGAVGLLVTGYDIGLGDGLTTSNVLDATFGVASIIPGVGWMISGAYFLVNTEVQLYSGKSIGEHWDE